MDSCSLCLDSVVLSCPPNIHPWTILATSYTKLNYRPGLNGRLNPPTRFMYWRYSVFFSFLIPPALFPGTRVFFVVPKPPKPIMACIALSPSSSSTTTSPSSSPSSSMGSPWEEFGVAVLFLLLLDSSSGEPLESKTLLPALLLPNRRCASSSSCFAPTLNCRDAPCSALAPPGLGLVGRGGLFWDGRSNLEAGLRAGDTERRGLRSLAGAAALLASILPSCLTL